MFSYIFFSFLQLGPSTPYLITGSEKWNRLDFGATVLFGLHLVYTNHMEKEVPDKGTLNTHCVYFLQQQVLIVVMKDYDSERSRLSCQSPHQRSGMW